MSEKVILALYEWWIDGQMDGQHETEPEPRAGAKGTGIHSQHTAKAEAERDQ